ncbi:hypothetical protein [Pengzhenrongella sp.]|uniref:hypothetical protein n=1 Tax=Pengzhenrongella sp. TaxID=2888820 RepID=UPI002F91DA5F
MTNFSSTRVEASWICAVDPTVVTLSSRPVSGIAQVGPTGSWGEVNGVVLVGCMSSR